MIQWELLLPGLLLGMLSSFHCIGMCGPIALSLPVRHLSISGKFWATALYNAGRVTMYALFGLIFGVLGREVQLQGGQRLFSISTGVLILLLITLSFKKGKFLHINPFPGLNSRIQQLIAFYLRPKNVIQMFFLGAANGLLPCGMVYLALTGAAATGSVTGGVAFMSFFGLGTVPALFALGCFGFIIKMSVRNKIKLMTPYAMGLMGILLILRGLNLGIPFISPILENFSNNSISCN